MTTVIIRNVVIDSSKDVSFETSNVKEFLFNHFKAWPVTAKLYQAEILVENEIRLETPDDVTALETLKGTIWVVIYPAGALLGVVLLGAAVAGMIYLQLSSGSKSNASQTAVQRESPNNGLSERTNANRLNGRIPDIFGKVSATPDLLSQPYKKYEDNIQVEYAYFCVGRGEYEITKVRDDKTLASRIDGMSVEVYGPGTSPNSGSPQLLIGDAITEPLNTVIKSNDVTGQTLDPPDPGTTVYFYTDAFVIDNVSKLYLNMVCNDIQADIDFRVIVTELDESDAPIGTPYEVDLILTGDLTRASAQTFIVTPGFSGKVSVKMARLSEFVDNDQYVPTTPPSTDPNAAKTRDNLQWESMYSIKPVSISNFGNVTTVFTRTIANKSALEVKSRKLNMIAQRKVPFVNVDNTLGALTPSSLFRDIFVAVCLDPKIGNRDESEVDINNIRTTHSAASGYFGTERSIEFNYTFDDENLSFEETASIIAEAAFCIAYRSGSQIKISFEKEVAASTILFNHRNKLPGTETRSVTFGYTNDNDGIELEYVDEDDGSPLMYYIPQDQTAVNPQRVKRLGVQRRVQAYFHAYRLWNKLRYQNTTVEFDATQEALLLLRNERILVADNTRTNTMDGEIVSRVGTTLTLSQNVELDPLKNYTIFLQNNNGTIVTKTVVQGSAPNIVEIDSTTTVFLSLDDDLYARATYEIVENTSNRKQAFLVEEKQPRDNFVTTIKAVNYDSRYYQNDKDYIDEVVDIDGNII